MSFGLGIIEIERIIIIKVCLTMKYFTLCRFSIEQYNETKRTFIELK